MYDCTDDCGIALSPSGIETFRSPKTGCPRKWGFQKLARVPEEKRKWLDDGKEVHSHVESYLLRHVLPPTNTKAGKAAMAAIALLPQPHPQHAVEKHLFYKITFHALHGYPDLIPYVGAGTPEVWDLKTTSDLRWAKKPEELLVDSQALVYGTKVLRDRLKVDGSYPEAIRYRWLYVERSTPFKTRLVQAEQTSQKHFDLFHEHILGASQQMIEARRRYEERFTAEKNLQPTGEMIAYVNEILPPNIAACGAYGGCPFRAVCTIGGDASKERIMSGITGKPTKTLAERLAEKTAGRNGMEDVVSSASKPPKQTETSMTFAASAKTSIEKVAAGLMSARPAEKEISVNPPDAADAFAPVEPAPAKKAPKARKAALKERDEEETGAFTAEEIAEKEKDERIRQRAEEIKAAAAAAGPDQAELAELAAARTSFVLCVDCVPVGANSAEGGDVVNFSGITQRLLAQLNKDAGGPFELTEEAGYGRAPALFQAHVLDEGRIWDEIGSASYVVASRTDRYQNMLLGLLEEKAICVIVGVSR